jgi:hypothetical protein
MSRSEHLERWRRVAAGALDNGEADSAELLAWIRERAEKIVAADTRAAGERAGALVRALGLSSKSASLEPLRERLELLDSFSFLDDHGNVREPARGERMRNLVAVVRASGLVDEQVTDEELRKRLVRLFAR